MILDRLVQLSTIAAVLETIVDKHIERKRRDRQEERDRRIQEMEERIQRLEAAKETP